MDPKPPIVTSRQVGTGHTRIAPAVPNPAGIPAQVDHAHAFGETVKLGDKLNTTVEHKQPGVRMTADVQHLYNGTQVVSPGAVASQGLERAAMAVQPPSTPVEHLRAAESRLAAIDQALDNLAGERDAIEAGMSELRRRAHAELGGREHIEALEREADELRGELRRRDDELASLAERIASLEGASVSRKTAPAPDDPPPDGSESKASARKSGEGSKG